MKTFGLEGAAAYLNVSPDTMRDLASDGDVAGAKIGKAWVFTDEDLDEFLRSEIRKQTAKRRKAFPVSEAPVQSIPERKTQRRRPSLPPPLSELMAQ